MKYSMKSLWLMPVLVMEYCNITQSYLSMIPSIKDESVPLNLISFILWILPMRIKQNHRSREERKQRREETEWKHWLKAAGYRNSQEDSLLHFKEFTLWWTFNTLPQRITGFIFCGQFSFSGLHLRPADNTNTWPSSSSRWWLLFVEILHSCCGGAASQALHLPSMSLWMAHVLLLPSAGPTQPLTISDITSCLSSGWRFTLFDP